MSADKWILSHPGGPAGPFWGIVTQSGRVVALQIVEREHAEILQIMGNLLAFDPSTTQEVGMNILHILGSDFELYEPGSNKQAARCFAEAIIATIRDMRE